MRPSFVHAVIAFASLVIGCGSSSHPSGFDQGGGAGGSNGGDTFSGTGPNGVGSFQDGGANADNVDTGKYIPPTQLGCSTRAQDILILDFRSGWWAGGGGGPVFNKTALGAVVGACPGVTVDYHHFETSLHAKCVFKSGADGSCQALNPAVTVSDIEASFELKTIADYTQFWILSGSDQDQSDIPVGDSLFQGVMGDTKGACIPMLVAAGDGFITHANYIANDFGMGNVFTMMTNPPSFFSVSMFPAAPKTTISSANFAQHVLLNGVPQIVDQVSAFVQSAKGDSLAPSVPGSIYDVIAHDGAGNPTIAVGAAKLAGDGYRPFIFDAGWQRMYALGQDKGTDQYLKNIVMYMSLVGCKAAPIGPLK